MNATEPTVIDQLFAAALAANWRVKSRADLEAILDDFDATPWRRCHDWRNHVPEAVAECWRNLPIEAKLAAYIPANSDSLWEMWD